MVDKIIWTSGATWDLQGIYNDLEEDKADELVARVESSLTLLKAFPERASRYKKTNIRRLLVGHRNQYGIYYTISGRRIIIAAFARLGGNSEILDRLIRSRTNN